MRAFSFTQAANATYYQLWTSLQAVTGFNPANLAIPDRCCQLILNVSVASLISDNNNANVAGMPLPVNTPLVFQSSPANKINLKEIYISGTSAVVSGWIVF